MPAPDAPRGFVRPDGLPIADTLANLLDDHRQYYAANLTEMGKAPANFQTWTGSTTDGKSSTDDCGGWARSDPAAAAEIGQIAGGPNFANLGRLGCDATNSLMCVEVNYTTPLAAPTPQAGKLAFVSAAAFTPSSGLAAANALCSAEKSGAIALLATSTRSAKSLLTGSYVRADGVPIDFYGPFGDVDEATGIWQHADGSYVKPTAEQTPARVWAGSQVFNSTPVPAMHDCGDWSSASGTGDVGFIEAGQPAWGGNKANCSTPLPVYCVQP
jgi:hypothetical protein